MLNKYIFSLSYSMQNNMKHPHDVLTKTVSIAFLPIQMKVTPPTQYNTIKQAKMK